METELTNKDLSVADLPREKLIKQGPAGLSNAELIAIIPLAGTRTAPLAKICNTLIDYINDNMSNLANIEQQKRAFSNQRNGNRARSVSGYQKHRKIIIRSGAVEIVLCRNKFKLYKKIADEEKAYAIQLDTATGA